MNRRHFLSTIAALPAAHAATPLPNIVYVLADDLGAGDLACYNPDTKIPTPHINRFATEGVRFTDMHSPSSVCTPTRYGILTGRYCWRSKMKQGVLGGESPYLPEPGRMTVASMLKQKGYRTAGIGKWHLGLGTADKTDYTKPLKPGPLDAGFDSYFGIPASLDMPPYLYFENDHTVEQPTNQIGDIREQRGIFWRGGGIAPGFRHIDVLPKLTERATAFLKAQKGATKPFFLYLPLTGPHTPWLPTKPFQGKAKAGPYGDFVTQVDDTFGQVLAALKESGHADNTLVILTSDNGAHWTPEEIAMHNHRANGKLRGQKADIYDAGHRIPFIARWPGKTKPNTVSSQLGCLTDLMATAAAITDTKLPSGAAEDSYSLVPALTGSSAKTPVRDTIVHHSSMGLFAIRQGPWKLALGRGSWGFTAPQKITPKAGEPEGELYNLADDPLEQDNLYLKNVDMVKKLTAILDQYKRDGRSRPLS